MARLRTLLARRPWIYWLAILVLAGGLAAVVVTSLADVRRERDAWGRSVDVLVATRAIDVGDQLAGAFETRTVPAAVVPPSALTEMPPTATATQAVAAGETIVELDVVAERGPVALLPDGWVAIEVTLPSSSEAADPLTNSALFVSGDAASVYAEGLTLAPVAIVLDVDPRRAIVGVPADVAAVVAQAAERATALLGWRRSG